MPRSTRRTAWACVATLVLVAACWTPVAAADAADGRAYELVSPPVKHGADVAVDSPRTRVAVDGNAASFVSLGGFADVRGGGQATEYVSRRSSNANPGDNGWATHAITPPQAPLTLIGAFQGWDALWVGEFSADLSKGVFRAWSPVTNEDPNVANVENLYLRTDLTTPGAGSYTLLTQCPACAGPIAPFSVFQLPRIAGASADFSHVIFESNIKLTPDASAGPHLYEWANGALRLAGILPDDACGTPPCPASRSVAGPGAGLRPPNAISTDGSRIIFTDTSTSQLYERVDGSQTLPISASEKLSPDAAQAATYQTASPNGMHVFFTSSEQLTEDDDNSSIDLYMWNANAVGGHHLTRLSVDANLADGANDVQGVIGASDDGTYVYFVAGGQLVANKPLPSSSAIYVWHESASPQISYVGAMADPAPDTKADLVGNASIGGGIRARVTPDGKHMAFVSHSGEGLLSAHGGVDIDQTQCTSGRCQAFYVYDADTDALACATCVGGAPPTSDADTWAHTGGTLATALHLNHSFSDDGRWLFFHTTESLVPEDANGKSDVYEYDSQTGALHLISSKRDPADSYFMDASADGKDVFFATRQRLVKWDTDGNYDLYDARVDGGFPEPPPAATPCQADACQAAPSPGVTSTADGSAAYRGRGNVKAVSKSKPKAKPKKCKKGYVRKRIKRKVTCVKKRKVKKGKQATAQRRAR